MDPAETRHTLAAQVALLDNHKRILVTLAENMTRLSQQSETMVPLHPDLVDDAQRGSRVTDVQFRPV